MSDLSPRLAAGAALIAAIAFLALGAWVAWGGTRALDEGLFSALHGGGGPPAAPGSRSALAVFVTHLGSRWVVVPAMVLGAIALAIAGRRRDAVVLLIVALGVGALNSTLKGLWDRPRPDAAFHRVGVVDAAFPSGHAFLATAGYLALAAAWAPAARQRALPWLAAGSLALAVGFSRVVLGVHWPTDVLGGWLVGAAWALGCSLLLERRAG